MYNCINNEPVSKDMAFDYKNVGRRRRNAPLWALNLKAHPRTRAIAATLAGALVIFGSSARVAAQSLYVAPAQNLFVANWYYPGAIYELTPSGSQSTFFSGGLGEPEGLAFNSAGNLFVADSYDGNIDEITPAGSITTFATGLGDENSLAFNSAGNLFAADYADGNIYAFTPGGIRSTFATGLNKPGGLAFSATGTLFASDASGNIYEYTPGGTRTTFASGIINPFALAFNAAGDLYVGYGGTGVGQGGILEITPGGARTIIATGLYGPNQLAFDTYGNLFVADGNNVEKFTPNGSESVFATGMGNATGLAFQGQALPVPEPSQVSMALAGLAVLGLFIRRRAG